MRRAASAHWASSRWLPAYLNEYAWRYNHRDHDQFRALAAACGSAGLENRQLVDQDAEAAVGRVGVEPAGQADHRARV